VQQVRANPLTTVAGVAALSAGLALLFPSSRREAEVMGEVAGNIGEIARGAAEGAVEVGKSQVKALAETALGGVGGTVVDALVAVAENGTGIHAKIDADRA
jgi:hypothetical protein